MENTQTSLAEVFKPDPVMIEIANQEIEIVFDMLAFIELEKKYGSVDLVLQMLFGDVGTQLDTVVTYNDAPVLVEEIKVDGRPLAELLVQVDKTHAPVKHSDTLEILWAGMLHNNAIYNDQDVVTGYKISKRKVAESITFRNYKDINVKIVQSIIRDLAPNLGAGEEKNEPPALEVVTE